LVKGLPASPLLQTHGRRPDINGPRMGRIMEQAIGLITGGAEGAGVFAEIGGVSVSIQSSPIRGDRADETHSAWTLSSAA
jgi:hypothetical protein